MIKNRKLSENKKYKQFVKSTSGARNFNSKVRKRNEEKHIKFSKELTKNITPYESIVKSWLDLLNIKYEFQKIYYTNDEKRIPMIVDFYLPNRRLILEIDGKQHLEDPKQVYKDKMRDAYFINLGYKVVRVNNTDIRNISIEKFRNLIKNKK